MRASFQALDAGHLRLALPGGGQVAIAWRDITEVRAQAGPADGAALAHGLAVFAKGQTFWLAGLGPRRTQQLWQELAAAGVRAVAQVPASLPPPAPRHTLLLAGPGTGKTTALLAKAAQWLAGGTCQPEQVVMLAFTRAAADSLRQRLGTELGEPGRRIKVCTLHGLAGDILAQTHGVRPRLSPLAGAPEGLCLLLEANIQKELDQNPAFRKQALAFFAWHLHPVREALDFTSWEDLRAHLKTLDLRTLAGERVRSRGEWLIANWLFLHGIPYVYERPIPPALLPEGGNYRPDFFLPEHGVYIEHLGLDRAGRPPAFMDPARYLEILAWKRAWHASQPTRLVETLAWESAEGLLPAALAARLGAAGVVAHPLRWEVLRDKLHHGHTLSRLAALAGNFLRRLGSTGGTLESCRARAMQGRWREREARFLELMHPLAAAHRDALAEGGATDFDGLIAQAAAAVQSGAWRNPFAAVLLDEAQDLSPGRCALVRALCDAGARLLAAGDDRQAIFGFGGTDPGLLHRFGACFGPSRTLELRDTFRLGAGLAAVADAFIAKGARRRRQPLRAHRHGPPDPVRVVHAKHPRDGAARALAQITCPASVLILARYGATLRALPLQHWRRRFPQLAIEAKIIHAAKGLEADYAVILDLTAGRFPSSRAADPLLRLAHAAHEPFPHAEERRLFFVALTRAREAVWLVADKEKPSPFVAEVMAVEG